MTELSEKVRAWGRRLVAGAAAAIALPGLIGLAGGAPTAGAFSRPGLPVDLTLLLEARYPGSSPVRKVSHL